MQRANHQNGMVLIVVVGVLAVLSVMALTFARYMTIERRAAENLMHMDMARQFAKAGLAHLKEVLREDAADDHGPYSEHDSELSRWHQMSQPDSDLACSTAGELASYGCRILYEDANTVGAVSFHDHHSERNAVPPSFFYGARVTDEDAKFNINAMGSLDDVGHERDYRIRYSAFDASLARLIKTRLDAEEILVNETDDHRYGFAVFLARRIVRRRYGPDGEPGVAGEVLRALEQRPAFGQKHPNLPQEWIDLPENQPYDFDWGDTGTGFPTTLDNWTQIGSGRETAGDGFASGFMAQSLAPPFLESYAEVGTWRSHHSTEAPLWADDIGPEDPDGAVYPDEVFALGAYSQVPAGVRGADGTLYLETNLVPYPNVPPVDLDGMLIPEGQFQTDAEFVPDDDYNADDGTGSPRNDDRVYRSVAEVVPVIRQAVRELAAETSPGNRLESIREVGGEEVILDPNDEETISEAAAIVYRAIEDYLTVHSRAWTSASVNINADWSSDGFDNTGDGTIDGEGEYNWNDPELEAEDRIQRLVDLRRGLGLVEYDDAAGEYVPAYGLSIREANQLTVNIVDFMDGWTPEHRQMNNTPTRFLRNANDDDDLDNAEVVYGAEGLHVTEIMGTPSRLDDSSIEERIGDPDEDPMWVWEASPQDGWEGYYRVDDDVEDVPAIARLRFHADLKRGWYAFRLFAGKDSPDVIELQIGFGTTQPADGDWWTVELVDDGYGWHYLRDLDERLRPIEVDGTENLDMWIRVDWLAYELEEVRFFGIQLLPQFVSFTNIAKQSPFLAESHDIPLWNDLGYFTLWFHNLEGDFASLALFEEDTEAHFWDRFAETPGPETTRSVPAARADGRFPLNYGFFTVAMSERAYDKNFGDGSGEWGDSETEAYPVFFVGDISDIAAGEFMLGRTDMFVELRDAEGGELFAGGEIDFTPTSTVNEPEGVNLRDYVSAEKISIVSPNDRSISWWRDCEFGFDNTDPENPAYSLDFIHASQNVPLEVPEDPDRGILQGPGLAPGVGYLVRSCLNSAYEPLWDDVAGFPLFKTGTDLAEGHYVLPFILNRPYANPAWMGLVPSGEPFRTIDPDPDPETDPAGPRYMLGRLMKNALVEGVHARINVNTAPPEVLAAVMDGAYDEDAPDDPDRSFGSVRRVMQARPFETWDDFFNASEIWDNDPELPVADEGSWVQFWGNHRLSDAGGAPILADDSGAGTYADDFIDDSDEKEEWYRRFATVLDIRSHTFRARVDGLVFERGFYRRPRAQARLEAILDRSMDASGDGLPDIRLLEMRWLDPR